MSKVRVAYNNVFRLLFGYRKSCSASKMFVTNNIYNFEGHMRKHINDFLFCILCAIVPEIKLSYLILKQAYNKLI